MSKHDTFLAPQWTELTVPAAKSREGLVAASATLPKLPATLQDHILIQILISILHPSRERNILRSLMNLTNNKLNQNVAYRVLITLCPWFCHHLDPRKFWNCPSKFGWWLVIHIIIKLILNIIQLIVVIVQLIIIDRASDWRNAQAIIAISKMSMPRRGRARGYRYGMRDSTPRTEVKKRGIFGHSDDKSYDLRLFIYSW